MPGLNFESMEIKQFTLGQSNPTYLLTLADGIRLVLRKQPPGKILRGAHQVGREYQIMSALHDEIPGMHDNHVCFTQVEFPSYHRLCMLLQFQKLGYIVKIHQ